MTALQIFREGSEAEIQFYKNRRVILPFMSYYLDIT